MKKIVLLLLLLMSACTSEASLFSCCTQANLQHVMDQEWQAYTSDKTNFKGGIAMYIISPWGDYFMSSGMGNDMDYFHRFRCASVTKTFTAASIMLLHERGQLNIDHTISDNIPGTVIPYFPYN